MDTERIAFPSESKAYEDALEARRQALKKRLAERFPVTDPVVLELGSGHGHFLTAYAAAHPEEFCAGIDRIGDRVRRALKKRDRHGLENLDFIQCELDDFLACLPDGVRFRRIFALFPDPWPKRRHHKNRMISTGLLDALAERAVPGAEFCFRTDYRPYFDEAEARAGEHPAWAPAPESDWPFEAVTVFQQRAETYFSLVARRR